ncbi:MAG: hypothetical protein A2Z66_07105 [Chloroflexi bacterium RBG_13_66_10]|nr:MAG: hypothetical protein A2Z66_07105 [Chloroflexi bacterium RBG_13_66_10]
MDETSANPLIVVLLFLLRCLLPLVLMLGVSHLLRRWGLIGEPPPPPSPTLEENGQGKVNPGEGRIAG